MKILNEIRENFAATQNGIRKIECLPKEYTAWTIRMHDGYGVAVPYMGNIDIFENFSNAKICNRTLVIDNKEEPMLILSCTLDNLRYEFASVCAQFIDPGKDGIDRKNLIENPFVWWEKWRMLLGNTMYDKKSYSVLGELMVLKHLIELGEDVEWTGINRGTHDIESNKGSYEVKSTVKKYGASITVSGQHQLKSNKRLQLYFCRLEKSRLGECITDIAEKIVDLGYNKYKLEQQLASLGFEQGNSGRAEKYKVLEQRKYEINFNFPSITNDSFIDRKIPDSIVQIKYTVDLEGLNYSKW